MEKTVTVSAGDLNSNIRPTIIWTNHDESAVYVAGSKSAAVNSNTAFLVLNTSDGSTQQSWMGPPNMTPLKKPMGSNNIAFMYISGIHVKSNTGANVTSLTVNSAGGYGGVAWLTSLQGDVDYDGNLYMHALKEQASNSAVYNLFIAKYNSSATRQWQIEVKSVDAANTVVLLSMDASNTRIALSLLECTYSHDGKKWYVSGYGERRLLYLSAASGNTGTFGRFIFASNTTPTAFQATTNVGAWSYTFSPRSTTEASFNTFTPQTVTANNITFTKTTL